MTKKPETALKCFEQLGDAFKDLGKKIFIIFEPILKYILKHIWIYYLMLSIAVIYLIIASFKTNPVIILLLGISFILYNRYNN